MEQATTRMRGICKRFFEGKGFGFILGQDGTEFFFHFSAIQMEGFKVLSEGQGVEFEPANAEKGPIALNVVPTQDSTKGSS
jgi:CspA family cold shock protein